MNLVPATLAGNISSSKLRQFLSLFIRRRNNSTSSDLYRIRRSAVAPFTYCGELVNEFRRIMKISFVLTQKYCERKYMLDPCSAVSVIFSLSRVTLSSFRSI
ncbi:hypothetical protein KIN20_000160 [Parelaphostrongylus tenuis]|uniref:Uncharacterized protein n=1 Tax=Parelaphostrongylus tenuis TaxID=148309 RepID=A0AAD5LUC8_PARTN|nr:hypothetical protein KIN20_000160 [Parelaphostrongylus tenuis]